MNFEIEIVDVKKHFFYLKRVLVLFLFNKKRGFKNVEKFERLLKYFIEWIMEMYSSWLNDS